jgi:hypothetical protein
MLSSISTISGEIIPSKIIRFEALEPKLETGAKGQNTDVPPKVKSASFEKLNFGFVSKFEVRILKLCLNDLLLPLFHTLRHISRIDGKRGVFDNP